MFILGIDSCPPVELDNSAFRTKSHGMRIARSACQRFTSSATLQTSNKFTRSSFNSQGFSFDCFGCDRSSARARARSSIFWVRSLSRFEEVIPCTKLYTQYRRALHGELFDYHDEMRCASCNRATSRGVNSKLLPSVSCYLY